MSSYKTEDYQTGSVRIISPKFGKVIGTDVDLVLKSKGGNRVVVYVNDKRIGKFKVRKHIHLTGLPVGAITLKVVLKCNKKIVDDASVDVIVKKKKCEKKFSKDPIPAVIIEDFTVPDGYINFLVLQKAAIIDIRLLINSWGFGNVQPSIENLFNTFAWFGDEKTSVVTGSYYADDEIGAGPNPDFAIFPGFQVSLRQGQVAEPIYKKMVPPLWQEQGSTLYGTNWRIPVNTNPERHSKVVEPTPENPYVFAEDKLAEVLGQVRSEGKKAIIFNTGSHTDLDKFFTKYGTAYNDAILEVRISGGGFYNFASSDDSTSQRWAGNVFTDQIYSLASTDPQPVNYDRITQADWATKTAFHTMQELNIFMDPSAAQRVFSFLYDNGIKTVVLPLDATEPVLIGNSLDSLKDSPTPEGRYIYELISGMKAFEGEGFDFSISFWDILSGLTYLDPSIVNVNKNIKGKVNVNVLNSIQALKAAACGNPPHNPFNVLEVNPYVGQTTVDLDSESSITIILSVDREKSINALLTRLNSPVNSACQDMVGEKKC